MTDFVIKDPTTGRGAEVDDHGRLYVKANVVSHMAHHATYHKNAYVTNGSTTLSGTSETAIFHLVNDTTKDLELYDMFISTPSAAVIRMSINDSYTSGGATATTNNLNLSTSVVTGANQYTGGASDDLTLSSSNASTIFQSHVPAGFPSQFRVEGALVITPGKSITVWITGTTSDIKSRRKSRSY